MYWPWIVGGLIGAGGVCLVILLVWVRLVLVGGLGLSLPDDDGAGAAPSDVPARLSSSSRRFLSFLPVVRETF